MRDGDAVRHFRIDSKNGTAFKLQGVTVCTCALD